MGDVRYSVSSISGVFYYYRVRIQWSESSKNWKVSLHIVEGMGLTQTEEREISSTSAAELKEALQEPCKYFGIDPYLLLAAAEDGVATIRGSTVIRPILLPPGD